MKQVFPSTSLPMHEFSAEDMARREGIERAWHARSITDATLQRPEEERLPLPIAVNMLLASGLNERKTRHCVLVGVGALRLGHAMAQAGFFYNPNETPQPRAVPREPLCFNPSIVLLAGLLHDIVRYESEHAVRGGKLLTRYGLPQIGYAITCHTRLPVELLEVLGITERDGVNFRASMPSGSSKADIALGSAAALCVYVADKYAFNDLLVPIPIRFKLIRDFFFNPSPHTTVLEHMTLAVEQVMREACAEDPVDIADRPCDEQARRMPSPNTSLSQRCAALEQELWTLLPNQYHPRFHDQAELDKELSLPPRRYYNPAALKTPED